MRSSMLLSLAAASISAIYAQQVVLDRTKLVNWDSCNSEQQKIIKETWKDATKLAGGTKNIDWSSAAAVQFLGPGGRNDEHRLIMQRILNNAATFGPAWWFNPFTVGAIPHKYAGHQTLMNFTGESSNQVQGN